MKVLAINGSARKGGNTAQLLTMAMEELTAAGHETELMEMAGQVLAGCIGCYKCLEKKDKRCGVKNDKTNDYIEKMLAADAILLGSPTYFADVTANMKALIERAGMVSRVNGNLFRRKLGAGVVAVRRAGASHVFSTLNNFFLIGEMIVVGSSYWNIGRGRDAGQVREDEEGIKTMRDLGRNLAWLLEKTGR